MSEDDQELGRRDRALLYDVVEAADVLNIGRTNVYRLMNDGEIRSVKIGARRLIPRSVLEEYVSGLLDAS